MCCTRIKSHFSLIFQLLLCSLVEYINENIRILVRLTWIAKNLPLIICIHLFHSARTHSCQSGTNTFSVGSIAVFWFCCYSASYSTNAKQLEDRPEDKPADKS